ncbi:S9 family peptidase, partial [Mariniblastus sp.]|nr:S9 family peptidase [Mariniblastus sp.]
MFRFLIFIMVAAVVTSAHGQVGDDGKSEEKAKVSDVTEQEDPYLWLEDVTGPRSLDWVRKKNETTQRHFEASSDFKNLEGDLLEILDSDERIPFVSKAGEFYYNFWRDKDHERGIWRRTTLAEYRKAAPQWEVVLDLDKLAERENENWVWDGASLLRPGFERALIGLSRGGADASVTREFDMDRREFINEGFNRPEAKGNISWIDQDSVFIYTDFGDGTMTSSGYPRIAKLWRRGQPMEEAEVVYEGTVDDMYIGAMHDDTPGFERNFVQRTLAFYNDELYLRTDDGELQKIDAP